MAPCALGYMLLLNRRRVLPHNPCTIATVAAYLANANLLTEEIIPKELEFLSAKEMRKRGLLDEGLYSFGWWGIEESRWYGIDLGEAEKEE